MDDNTISSNAVSIPPGYIFSPSDEELVLHYLQKKVKKEPLPENRMQVVEIFNYSPQALSELYKPIGENNWYFFSSHPRLDLDKKKQEAGDGFWWFDGTEVQIDSGRKTIGRKKVMRFFKEGCPTHWFMDELRSNVNLNAWALCKLHKSRNRKDHLDIDLLPEGFKFCPTDEELVTEFLKKKLKQNKRFPPFKCIADMDLRKYNPEALIAMGKAFKEKTVFKSSGFKEDWYFFASGRNRRCAAGSWRFIGAKPIYSLIGWRRTFALYKPTVVRTDWLLDEYSLQNKSTELEDGILCRIHKKEEEEEEEDDDGNVGDESDIRYVG